MKKARKLNIFGKATMETLDDDPIGTVAADPNHPQNKLALEAEIERRKSWDHTLQGLLKHVTYTVTSALALDQIFNNGEARKALVSKVVDGVKRLLPPKI